MPDRLDPGDIEEPALTRTQVLAARNGDAPAVETGTRVPVVSPPEDKASEAPAPAEPCAVCHGPIPPERVRQRALTCSSECNAERTRQRKAGFDRSRTRNARGAPPPVLPPASEPTELACAARAFLTSLGDLSGVDRLSIELDGRVLTVE